VAALDDVIVSQHGLREDGAPQLPLKPPEPPRLACAEAQPPEWQAAAANTVGLLGSRLPLANTRPQMPGLPGSRALRDAAALEAGAILAVLRARWWAMLHFGLAVPLGAILFKPARCAAGGWQLPNTPH
jgi:hypothetical protein